ncbi:MAG: FHA domain-containing protein, partial [Victivallaceae bacterium]
MKNKWEESILAKDGELIMAGNPKLIILSERLRGKSFELNKDVMSAGRSEQRDICIKDTTLSSHHCDFIKQGDKYILHDNNSTNGTRVNNNP